MKKFTWVLTILCSLLVNDTYAQLGKCKGKYFGNIIPGSVPSTYNTYWNQATSENGSKWGSVEGTQGVYNFATSDIAYNWAKNNNGFFKYHNFIWGSQTPGWVNTASTAVITAAIEPYIKAIADHYNPLGGIDLIDVLNEPVNTALPGNLKAALTAGYQAEPANAADKSNQYGWAIWCYQLARKYFPNAKLLINEYNTEMNWNNCRPTYLAIINAIQNAPNLTDGKKNLIDGVGLQCHGVDNLTAANFQSYLDQIWTQTGLPAHLTEFDQAANPNEAKQQSVYSTLIPIAWNHPHVAGITFWGYIQGTTWINGNGTAGPSGTDSGILYSSSYATSPLGERPAMTWLKSFASSLPNLPTCPLPGTVGPGWGSLPTITITSPLNGATYTAPASVTISAAASDYFGTITGVSFYNGNTLLGSDATSPYTYTWTNVPTGTYKINAIAKDNLGTTATATSINITVNPGTGTVPSPAGTITGSSALCAGQTGVTYTISTVSGATSYKWIIPSGAVLTSSTSTTNGITLTIGTTGGIISVYPINSFGTGTGSNLTVSVAGIQLSSVNIISSAISVCSGTGVTFTATGINSGTAPVYTWFKNNVSQSTGTTFNLVPSNGDVVKAVLTAGGTLPTCFSNTSATSTGVTLSVTGTVFSSVNIVASTTSVCSGTGVTFTATGVNTGTAPVYTWFKNNTSQSTGATFNFVPSNGDIVKAVLTAGGTLPACLSITTASSLSTTLSVTSIVSPSVSIAVSSNSICSGATVTFSATAFNGGSSPVYTWFKNNILQASGTTFSFIPSNGDIVKSTLLVGGVLPVCLSVTSVTSLGVALSITSNISPSVSISASSNSVCSGSTVTLTATGSNGGSSPVYTWFKNKIAQTTGVTYSYVPANGDIISAVLSAGGILPTCLPNTTATSSGVSLAVTNNVTPSVTIIASSNSICSGGIVSFTATGSNGGSLPVYTWLKNNIIQSTGSTYSYNPSIGDVIKAYLIVGGAFPSCLTSTTATSIGLTTNVISNLSPTVSIISTSNSVCSGNTVAFTATGVNGGSAPVYNWFKNNVQQSTGTIFTYTPSNGDVVKAILTAGGTLPNCLLKTSATSAGITLTVSGTLIPSISISSTSNSVCSGASVSFTASGINAGATPTYNWYVNQGFQSTGNTFTYLPSNNDVVYATLLAGGNIPTCLSGTTATASGTTLTVTAGSSPSVSIVASSNSVCSGTGVIFTATGVNAGTLPTYQWIVNNQLFGNGTSFTYIPTSGDVVEAVLVAGGSLPTCLSVSSATSTGITLTAIPLGQSPCSLPVPGSITGPAYVLAGSNNVIYSVPNVPNDTYQWSVPTGATITGGLGTNSITVSYSNLPISGLIDLNESNSNGSSNVSLLVNTGLIPSTTPINGPTTVNSNEQGTTYSVSTILGTLYTWSISGGTIVSGQGTGSIIVDWGTSGGTVTLGQSNNYGNTSQSITISQSITTGLIIKEEFIGLVIYPNPFREGFSIRYNGQFNYTLFNLEGVRLETGTEQTIDIGKQLNSGTYIIKLQRDNTLIYRKVVKE